jgi:hypothetical protein
VSKKRKKEKKKKTRSKIGRLLPKNIKNGRKMTKIEKKSAHALVREC